MPEAIASTTFLKNSSYIIAFIVSFEYLGFNPEMMAALGFLMITDIITAIARVWLNEGGRNIRSAVLKRGITAKLLLWAGLFSVAVASKAIGLDMQKFAQATVTVIILGELYSVLGNIHSARTGEPKVEFDAVAWMLGRVKKMLTQVIK